ncbi:heavy metal translocating P-type ATPase, partial [Candidatus Bathyarchaeota archaeon]
MQHQNNQKHEKMNMQEMKHESSGHMMHTGMFKKRFFVCLALTIPVLLLSETIQTWFQFTITIPYQQYVLLALAAIIYVYGGWPFLKGLT